MQEPAGSQEIDTRPDAGDKDDANKIVQPGERDLRQKAKQQERDQDHGDACAQHFDGIEEEISQLEVEEKAAK